ncbi:hypothetical protein MBLNU459_g3041t1 [Dothideomycetes sp. NU459]
MATTSPVKAWTFTHGGYPSSLHKSALPGPGSSGPAPTELHVRVKAVALNPVDIQIMNLPVWPYVPTFVVPAEKGIAEDFSGVVERAGAESGFREGDEVFGITFSLSGGTLQELVVVDTKASVVVKKPDGWSWEQAAALPLVWLTARTTIAAVEPNISASKRVAVLGGSSSVGMYAVHLAASRGWTVLATCSARNTSFVESMGAATVVDYNRGSVAEAVRGFAPDAIIDCVGGTECLGVAKRYVTIVGDKTSRASMGGAMIYLWNPQMLLRNFLGRWGLGLKYDCVNLAFDRGYLEEALRLDKQKIAVDSTFEFDQVREAFERLNTGRTRGKVIVKVG